VGSGSGAAAIVGAEGQASLDQSNANDIHGDVDCSRVIVDTDVIGDSGVIGEASGPARAVTATSTATATANGGVAS
jgi:hypothetical protein